MTGISGAEREQLALDTLAEPLLWRPIAVGSVAPDPRAVSRGNLVRERAFLARITEPSAGVIAELVELAPQARAEGNRGQEIERLLVLKGYAPDKQPEAIKLVMEQMESMAPRYSEERRG